ncbi:hypothetical protein [Planobispora longispora]|uniref:hypothetical protein n=1 Tax=Planobispora longispora TaxID=28887 RepID=UPI00194308F8|nr:hypothetical protein [Planobispora longispora]
MAAGNVGERSWGRGTSRIHRVTVDGQGRAELGEQVGSDLEGVVRDLAVSPDGRVAYARLLAGTGGGPEVARTVVGVLDPAREWSAPGYHGSWDGRQDPIGLHWADRSTLAFRANRNPEKGSEVLALDVRGGGDDLLAAERVLAMSAYWSGTAVVTADSVLLSYSDTMNRVNHGVLVYDRATGEPRGHAYAGDFSAFTLDASGRYLLVGRGRCGEIVHPLGVDVQRTPAGPSYELVKVDLDPPVTPAPTTSGYDYPGELTREVITVRAARRNRPAFGLTASASAGPSPQSPRLVVHRAEPACTCRRRA